eukprot:TRINITY_DN13159_c0_g1_i1.p1 TRINITY_DN13159_c0_g1~~TRINITY_DN13159_c0_g1_i1.p1  ORF type:complete len:280 (-),score=17.77 TRINITY_DN13159_c0_g1_i1:421-1260(-)
MTLSLTVLLFFFFKATATTEIYTLHIVGSVRCVQETGTWDSTSDISGKTALAFGLSAFYPANDYILFSLSYLYSQEKVTYTGTDLIELTDHNRYQALEFSANLIANPYSRINFYGIIGYSLFNNTYNKDAVLGTKSTDTKSSVNFGLGFIINIPTKYGLITPTAEWKLNWLLGESNVTRIENNVQKDYKITNFFSTPRFTLVWYPKFQIIRNIYAKTNFSFRFGVRILNFKRRRQRQCGGQKQKNYQNKKQWKNDGNSYKTAICDNGHTKQPRAWQNRH